MFTIPPLIEFPFRTATVRRRWCRAIWPRWQDDRGAATAELVLAVPLLMLLLLLIAQFALYLHATHVAQAAAAQALSVTRVEGGTAATGQADAEQILQQLAGGPLRNPHVNVSRDAVEAHVHIRGEVTAVIPFLHLVVQADAAGPDERFVPNG